MNNEGIVKSVHIYYLIKHHFKITQSHQFNQILNFSLECGLTRLLNLRKQQQLFLLCRKMYDSLLNCLGLSNYSVHSIMWHMWYRRLLKTRVSISSMLPNSMSKSEFSIIQITHGLRYFFNLMVFKVHDEQSSAR